MPGSSPGWGNGGRSQRRRGALAALLLLLVVGAVPGAVAAQVPDETERFITISRADRMLWLVEGADTLLEAPIAVGREETARHGGLEFDWRTPAGDRRILGKRENPVWRVPDWHYLERADWEGLELVRLERGRRYDLPDGSWLEIRGDQVVRATSDGAWAVPPGREIVLDGVLYMPPVGTAQRRVPGALGAWALDMGDGYLIHGTHRYNRESVGTAASHGCIRMAPDAMERLYGLVAVGTLVRIQ